jgi:hypothetical protein
MMGDTDFPIAMGGQGGSPYEELDPQLLRRLNQPGTVPPGGIKEFLKQYLPKVPGTQKPTGYVREELEGERSFAQSGTGIPDFQVGQAYEQREGGPVFEQMVAQGIPVGVDPDLPMSQEQFSDFVRGRLDKSKPTPPLSPELKQRIQNFRSKYSHLFV